MAGYNEPRDQNREIESAVRNLLSCIRRQSNPQTSGHVDSSPTTVGAQAGTSVSFGAGQSISKPNTVQTEMQSFRLMKAGGRCLNGGALTSGLRRDRGEGGSEDFSQDSTSMTMPSGVSSFLLDCLDVDSPTSDEDSALSSIEEFRRADNYDGALLAEDGLMNRVKNSTLLDLSDAQDLALQPPPNLSSILEFSLDPAEDLEMLAPVRSSPVRVPSDVSSGGGVLRSAEERTPVNTRLVVLSPVRKKCLGEKGKLMKCRKVTFSDIVSVRNVSSCKRDQRAQRDERIQPDGSLDVPSGPVRFFDFADVCEREAFFHRLKQTHSITFPAKPIL